MHGLVKLLILALGAFALSGCVASLVAAAAGTAVQAAQGRPESNAHLQPNAKTACSDHAARYGTVHIIDVVQRSVDTITVWGTVDDGKQRRSFECGFKTAISSFKLREIRTSQ